jgi:hypothetical protein
MNTKIAEKNKKEEFTYKYCYGKFIKIGTIKTRENEKTNLNNKKVNELL